MIGGLSVPETDGPPRISRRCHAWRVVGAWPTVRMMGTPFRRAWRFGRRRHPAEPAHADAIAPCLAMWTRPHRAWCDSDEIGRADRAAEDVLHGRCDVVGGACAPRPLRRRSRARARPPARLRSPH